MSQSNDCSFKNIVVKHMWLAAPQCLIISRHVETLYQHVKLYTNSVTLVLFFFLIVHLCVTVGDPRHDLLTVLASPKSLTSDKLRPAVARSCHSSPQTSMLITISTNFTFPSYNSHIYFLFPDLRCQEKLVCARII